MNLPSNLWKSPVIKQRLEVEALVEGKTGISIKPFYWVVVPEADSKDGFHILQNYKSDLSHVDPHMMQQEFAKGLQRELQREAGWDGLWLVGYSHPPSTYDALTDGNNCWDRLFMIWHDEDGDPQYTIDSILPFVEQIQGGTEGYVQMAHEAHPQWKEVYSPSILKKEMILDDDQTGRVALEALKDV